MNNKELKVLHEVKAYKPNSNVTCTCGLTFLAVPMPRETTGEALARALGEHVHGVAQQSDYIKETLVRLMARPRTTVMLTLIDDDWQHMASEIHPDVLVDDNEAQVLETYLSSILGCTDGPVQTELMNSSDWINCQVFKVGQIVSIKQDWLESDLRKIVEGRFTVDSEGINVVYEVERLDGREPSRSVVDSWELEAVTP